MHEQQDHGRRSGTLEHEQQDHRRLGRDCTHKKIMGDLDVIAHTTRNMPYLLKRISLPMSLILKKSYG